MMFRFRADLKCHLCGRTAGELETEAGENPLIQRFRPAPGMESLLGMKLQEARCPRCGGTLFVEEVERVYFLSDRPIKPEKRGRKPKPRPEPVAS